VVLAGPDGEARGDLPCEVVGIGDVLAGDGDDPEPGATEADPESPAYVMFTSGSTGLPRGVVVPHRAVLHLACDSDYLRLGPGDRVACAANPAFDASTFELWGSLLNGATLVVLDRDAVLSPGSLAAALRRDGVDTLFLTTALFHLLAREAPGTLPRLGNLLFGGERADPAAVRALLAAAPPKRLLHVYGPTEATTFATWHAVADVEGDGGVPIGRPLARVTARVLDAAGAEAPAGTPGELYLGGPGVALGYLGDPARTAERFVPDPFSPVAGTRLYRTGDRVRWRADGTLAFLGRLDAQVKVRGFRVEPGEVEDALRRTGLVRDAAVVAREDAAGTLALAAYVVPRNGSGPDEIRRALAAALPAHLVPAWVEVLPALPLGPTGKVARGALPPPRAVGGAPAGRGLTPAEERLAGIWRRVLGVARVGPDDDFFALGGHSLLAVRLFGAIERELGERLPVSVLFRRPTLAGVAEALGQPREWQPLVEMQPGDGRAPLFVVHAADGNVLRYRALAQRLGAGRPVFGLQAPGLDGRQAPLLSVEALAERHLPEVRRACPAGPVHLAGLSLGGQVAFELACRLAAEGRQVGVVALFDTHLGIVQDLPLGLRARYRLLDLPHQLRGYAGRLREAGVRLAPASLRQIGIEWVRRRRLVRWSPGAPPLDPPLTLIEAGLVAARRYVPGRYPGRVTWYVARGNLRLTRLFPGWSPHVAGGLEVVPVPGTHFDLVDEPNVAAVAAHLRRALDACDAAAGAALASG
jgi:amino acid adenylation domain-containing protein